MEVYRHENGYVFVWRTGENAVIAEFFATDDPQFLHRLKCHFDRCDMLLNKELSNAKDL